MVDFGKLGFENVERGFCYFESKMCILGFKMMILLLDVDIGTFGLILRLEGKNPNLLYKLIGVINLGILLLFGIELEIRKLAHYIVKRWSWIY